MSGFLSGGTQGDVYPPIVGQDQNLQITQHLFPVVGAQVRILRDLFLDLFRIQIVTGGRRRGREEVPEG